MRNHNRIDAELAAQFAPYAMMSSNCYHDHDRPFFDLSPLGWQLIDGNGREIEDARTNASFSGPISGLAYDLYRHTDRSIVMAVRGTDSLCDWILTNFAFPFSIQYKSARKHFREINDTLGKVKAVTGHSLGGGIAFSISVKFGVDAIAFDGSPRIFDGLGDKHAQARRQLVYQSKDPLDAVRRRWAKISEVLRPEDTFVTNFNFRGRNAHAAHLLARGLVEMGASAEESLRLVADQLPPPAVWSLEENPA